MTTRSTRRRLLQTISAAAAAGAIAPAFLAGSARAQSRPADQKLLFVVAAAGGGSLIDSFMPILDPGSSPIVSYPANLIGQANGFRCVHAPFPINLGGFNVTGHLLPFAQRHGQDMAVMAQESTSVNHIIAQKRSLTGAGINGGRTILEAMAIRHGDGLILPNVNMCESGYLEPGDDASISDRARAVAVADALLFPFATDGFRGIQNAPARPLLERARQVRSRLDKESVHGITFRDAPMRRNYLDNRDRVAPQMEARDLITRLTMVANVPGQVPLNDFGLESSPDGAAVRAKFPDLLNDPLEAQAALAFLLARHKVSCAMAISPSFNPLLEGGLKNTPLAFDFSHTNHVLTQYAMWSRVLKVTDGLIALLKAQDWDDNDPSEGKMWDRSVVYIATDFGRDKTRPPGSFEFGSGHHLNNGNVIISPLVRGGRVYGDVDPATGLTFGFNRTTGVAEPGTLMHEGDVYSVLAQALDIDFAGRTDVPIMVRS
jgi:hypothetical protein